MSIEPKPRLLLSAMMRLLSTIVEFEYCVTLPPQTGKAILVPVLYRLYGNAKDRNTIRPPEILFIVPPNDKNYSSHSSPGQVDRTGSQCPACRSANGSRRRECS